MDPEALADVLTAATRAILVVHQVGMPCDLERILEIARARGLPVVEDAACAAGSERQVGGRWSRIGGSGGELACFSLHARKPITTGEGGMITCRDAGLAEQLRLMRNHGMTADAVARHRASAVAFEDYVAPYGNHRLSDIAGAIGRAQLRRLPAMTVRRRAIAARYHSLLEVTQAAAPLAEPEWARSNWQSYPVELPYGADQWVVMQRMLDAGIATRRGVMCAHLTRAWPKGTWSCGAERCCTGQACGALRRSETARDRQILLPLFTSLGETDQARIVETLSRACAR